MILMASSTSLPFFMGLMIFSRRVILNLRSGNAYKEFVL